MLYRLDGKQSSTSFEDLPSAIRFQKLVEKFGPAKALESLGADPEFAAMTVRGWIEHHIEHLTGLRKSAAYDYRSYLKNDIAEPLGDLPLAALSPYQPARCPFGELKASVDAGRYRSGLCAAYRNTQALAMTA